MNRKFAYKLLFYTLFVLYLVGDLHVWNGFFSRKLNDHFRPVPTLPGDDSEVDVYVYGEAISRNQLAREKAEIGFLRGEEMNSPRFPEKKRLEMLDNAARINLIRGALLRLTARYSDMNLPDTRDSAREEVDILASRFGKGEDSFLNVLARQKSDPSLFTNMVAARLKQKSLLSDFAGKVSLVPDGEIKFYYDRIKDKIAVPSRRRLSHIFLEKLNKDPEEVQKTAQTLLKKLESGEPFARLAQEFSEDRRSSKKGGDLGVVTANRPGLLKGVDLFGLPSGKPVLKESAIGWHIFLAEPVQEGYIPKFEDVRELITNALYSMRQDRAIDLYMDEALREAHIQQRIRRRSP